MGYLMTKSLKALINLSLVLLSSIFLSTSVSAMTMTNMNDGQPTSIKDYLGEGKWLIVEAWHSKCGVCMKSMPAFVKSKGTFPDAKLIGVSLDGNKTKAQNVINRFKVNFPTLLTSISDFDKYVRQVAKKPLKGAPTYLIFDPQGKLRAMQSGYLSPKDIKKYLKKQKLKLNLMDKLSTE